MMSSSRLMLLAMDYLDAEHNFDFDFDSKVETATHNHGAEHEQHAFHD